MQDAVDKVDLKGLPEKALVEKLARIEIPSYRAKQIMSWIYKKDVSDFKQMTDLPAELRGELSASFFITKLPIIDKRESKDGTIKLLLGLGDRAGVESVGIPEGRRLTVCFSTQVGCAMACGFCATGLGGCVRNLDPGEIVDQVQRVGAFFRRRVSNAVAMGQGEPFANYDATLSAFKILNSKDGLNIGARHLTVSTCGIVPGIERFAEEPEQFGLAVSLHSAIQEKRAALMPIARRYDLASLKGACRLYTKKTNRRVTFEYALMKGENDGAEDLRALAKFCADLLCHINLIPLNPVGALTKVRSEKRTIDLFHKTLNGAGIETSVRIERGSDIEAACGQLAHVNREAL